ncbi:Ras-related protein Rab-4B [Trichinella spiralis]|uniref:Ras-related protein Rab-4B n=1 Tax=Trichinella spiralis TaxID=6334 RepID=A0A0V1AVU6_TRISP|nr:Ras-related protein Rab-4B [Trichinella spiralis]
MVSCYYFTSNLLAPFVTALELDFLIKKIPICQEGNVGERFGKILFSLIGFKRGVVYIVTAVPTFIPGFTGIFPAIAGMFLLVLGIAYAMQRWIPVDEFDHVNPATTTGGSAAQYLQWLKLWVHKEIDDDAMYAFVHQAFPSEKRSLHDDFFISLVNDVCKIDFARNVKRNFCQEFGKSFLKNKVDKSSEDYIPTLKREQSIRLLRSLCATDLSKLALFLLAFSKDIEVIHEDAFTCLLEGSEILIKNRMEDIIQAARSRMSGSEEVCLKCAVVKHQTSLCAETKTKVEDSQSESIKCRVTLEDIICLNFLLLGTRELASPVYFTNFWKINETKLVISLRLHFQVQFKQDTAHTIGIEFGSKVVKIQDRSIKLQVWDTAGQERFRSLTKNYYNGAACALLVYDITCRQSFNAIAQWLSDARSLASPQIIVILIGNKKDLEDRREVTFMEGSQFAQENGMLFLETSALTGENIEETFLRCARSILTKIESGELDPNRVGYGIQFGHVEMKPIKSDCSNVHARCNSCST